MKTTLPIAMALFGSVFFALLSTTQAQTPPSSSLPPEAQEMMSKLVGTWITEGKRNGESFSGLYQARWNEARTGLIYHSREGNKLSHGVGYWDFKTHELVETWPGTDLTAVVRFKADRENPLRWTAAPWLQLFDGRQIETSHAHLTFADNEFRFSGDAGSETLVTTNTRVDASDSKASLQELGDFLVGGTWICNDEQPPARHTYQWRTGNKILMLDRLGGRYPGISLITFDQEWQCVRFIEADDSGMLGSAILTRDDKDTWHLFGHYQSASEVQDLQIKLARVGANEIRVTGIETVNGVAGDWNLTWNRSTSKP